MDERFILEREVMRHRAAIAELMASIADIEQSLKQAAEPERLERKAAALRLAVEGRSAAVAVGSARLGVLMRCASAGEKAA